MDSIHLLSGGVTTLSQTVIRDRSIFRGLKLTFSTKLLATANSSKLLATGEKLKSTLWICMPARPITAISEIKYQTLISKEWYYFLFFNHCVWLYQKETLQQKLWRGSNINTALRKPGLFYYRGSAAEHLYYMMHLIRKEQDILEPVSIQHEVMTKSCLSAKWILKGQPRKRRTRRPPVNHKTGTPSYQANHYLGHILIFWRLLQTFQQILSLY